MEVFRSKLFLRFFSSFLIIFLIPLSILSGAVFFYTQRVIEQSKLDGMASIAETHAQSLDEVLYYVSNIAFNLSYNPTLYSLDRNQYSRTAELNLELKPLIKELNVSMTQFARSRELMMGLYIARNDVVITGTTKYSMPDYCESVLGLYSPEEIRNMLLGSSYTGRSMMLPSSSNRGERMVCMLSIDLYGSPSNTYLIVSIPSSAIPGFSEDRIASALYYGDQLIAANNTDFFSAFSLSQLRQEERVDFDKKEYFPLLTPASLMGLTYVSCIERGIVSGPVHLLYLFLLLVVLVFFLGILAAYLMSKRNYKPVGHIMQLIENYSTLPSDSADTEFQRIRSMLSDLMNRNAQLNQQVGEQLPVLRSAYLGRMLRSPSVHSSEQDHEAYGITFPYPQFAVLAVALDPGGQAQFVEDVFRTLLSSSFSHSYDGYTVYAADDYHEYLPLILNFSAQKTVEETAREFLAQLPEHVLAGCSSARQESELPTAYTQAVKAFYCGRFGKETGLILFDSLSHVGGRFLYSTDQEQALYGCIHEKDVAGAKRLITGIIRENAEYNAYSTSLTRVLMSDLLATLLKTASSMGLDLEQLWTEQNFRQFDEAGIHRKTALLEELVDRIDSQTERRQEAQNPLVTRTLELVKQEYGNPGLSLNYAAELFGVSSQYLSGLFKAQAGRNFTDYVNQYRLKMSLLDLQDPSIPIGIVAEKAGYLGAGNYIRVFKKYYSVTPGQYREQMLRTQQDEHS
jgi:two-component system response regulator YesN